MLLAKLLRELYDLKLLTNDSDPLHALSDEEVLDPRPCRSKQSTWLPWYSLVNSCVAWSLFPSQILFIGMETPRHHDSLFKLEIFLFLMIYSFNLSCCCIDING